MPGKQRKKSFLAPQACAQRSAPKSVSRLYNPAIVILKLALFMWFVALCISLVAKGKSRSWMPRLFLGGFVLLLLGFFLKLVSRVI